MLAGGARSTRSGSMPSCTVTTRSRATPSSTSRSSMAREAAIRQSTCRYFQRENELRFRRKSTRRAATNSGRGGGAPKGRGRRGGGRAGGVVRVDDLRPELSDDPPEPPGRGQVHLVPQREPDQIVAFRHPPEEFAARVGHEHGAGRG